MTQRTIRVSASKVPELTYFQRCRAWAKREAGQSWAEIAGHYELTEDDLLKQLTKHHAADSAKEKASEEKHRQDTERYKKWKRYFGHLPRNHFEVIYADPPWKYDNKGGRGAADKHYDTMTLGDICALPISEIAAENAVLFMWHVPTMPLEAIEVVQAWGFELVTFKGFTWAKMTSTQRKWFLGLGFYTRGNSEDCLIAVRGKKFERSSKAVRQLIIDQSVVDEVCPDTMEIDQLVVAPFTRHSAKPPQVRDRIVQLYGDRPRIELFARDAAPGWTAWGDQAPEGEE